MESWITFVEAHHIGLVVGTLLCFGLLEATLGYLANSKRSKDDVMVETISAFVLMAFTKPIIVLLSFLIAQRLLPTYAGSWEGLPFWAGLLVFLLVDDLLQYWYHRSAHEYKWLWKWHRAHHTATEMGLLVSYREAIYFFTLMPNVWWLGVFTFLGGATPVAVGIVLKQLVVISSHSLLTWDSFFHRHQTLRPVLLVLERIFITPAFHHAHHAVSKLDGVGNPNGNYGNMFSFWDQLFGTATFVHTYPTAYGIEDDPQDGWAAQTLYPLVKSDKPGSELAADFELVSHKRPEPAVLSLDPGAYLFCTCGYSKTQPFCDGSHQGTKFQPERLVITRAREYRLCQCKQAAGPFCDNSHLSLESPDTRPKGGEVL
jgi:sterol desaturase/sphingolipid hydroxylase (fatty acid hydroxylase superfamily)/CDGSH-type Zn-finger protein